MLIELNVEQLKTVNPAKVLLFLFLKITLLSFAKIIDKHNSIRKYHFYIN